MLSDDVARSSDNPFPGQLFNAPTNAGDTFYDVYPGCVDERSYVGSNVTAANFLAVLTGNSSVATGAVLESGPRSHVLLAFFDHGAGGLVCFPEGPMLYVRRAQAHARTIPPNHTLSPPPHNPTQADELGAALDTMHGTGMYGQLVFYMEACESGSMFPSLPNNTRAYATTAADADESSWGTFCPPDSDTVNGTHIDSCLGDLYSVRGRHQPAHTHRNTSNLTRTAVPFDAGELDGDGRRELHHLLDGRPLVLHAVHHGPDGERHGRDEPLCGASLRGRNRARPRRDRRVGVGLCVARGARQALAPLHAPPRQRLVALGRARVARCAPRAPRAWQQHNRDGRRKARARRIRRARDGLQRAVRRALALALRVER